MHGHMTSLWLCHPLRHMRPRTVRLLDDQKIAAVQPRAAENFDFMPHLRVEGVIDASPLRALFAGTM